MIKFIAKSLIVISFLIMNSAHAGLIKSDLTENNYVQIGDLQWAWASPVNTEFYQDGAINNQLYAPTYDTFDFGWRFANSNELTSLMNTIEVFGFEHFFVRQGSFVHGFNFWNSFYSGPANANDAAGGFFSSTWIENEAFYLQADIKTQEYYQLLLEQKDTFYVRDAAQAPATITQVPEPSTLLIFSLGLILVSLRLKQ